jgi:hypothetical protein
MYRRNHIYYNKIFRKGDKRMAEQRRKISYGIDFEVNDAELKKLKKQLE